MRERARQAWAETVLKIWPNVYWNLSFDLEDRAFAAGLLADCEGRFACLVQDHRELSLTVEETLWRRHEAAGRHRGALGPLRAVTFDIPLEIEVVGYLAPAAQRLAEAGVSIIPQCAFSMDHLLVLDKDLETARQVLEALIEEVRGDAST